MCSFTSPLTYLCNHLMYSRQQTAISGEKKVTRKVNLFHISILIIGSILLYWPVYTFDFLIGWDDQWFVTNRYTENGLNWQNFYDILSHFHYGQYAPVNQLYYTILYTLFGYNSSYFHMASFMLHFINSILIYLLIIITCKFMLGEKSNVRINVLSFLTAFMFAILPINVEPVAWISASKVLLYALFYLMALLSYCFYMLKLHSIYFYLTIIFFVISFGCKEQAVVLPLCLILFDYLFGRNLKQWTIWLEKLPFFMLALFFGVVTIQSQELEYGARSFYPIIERIPLSAYTLIEYLTKSLIPINLSYLYPFPFLNGEPMPWWLLIYVIVIPAIIFCFYEYLRFKWVVFGAFIFIIHTVLVLNLFSLARFSIIADRYAYLAAIGPCFILSYIVMVKLRRGTKKNKAFVMTATSISLYFLLLAWYSQSHLTTWKNTYSLKERLKKIIEERKDFDDIKKFK